MTASYKGFLIPEYTDAADGPQAFTDIVDSGPIPRFNTVNARESAIPSPVAGLLCWISGGAYYSFYDGAKWTRLTDDFAARSHKHTASDITSGTLNANRLPWGTLSAGGRVRLKNSVTSTATDNWAAPPAAVKTAYDKAVAAFNNAATALELAGHAHPYVKTSGDSTIAGILTVTDEIRVSQGSASDPSLILVEGSNDTGIYANDNLSRIGLTIDGGVADYIFSKSGLSSIVAGKNIGAASFPWKNLYLTGSVQAAFINGFDVEEIVAAVNSLISGARFRGDSVLPGITRNPVESGAL